MSSATGFTFGYITRDNVVDLHERVRALLFDDEGKPRRYTWVAAYEYAGYRPEVRTGQTVEEVKLTTGDRFAIQVLDSYGVWALSVPQVADDYRMYVVISDRHMQVRLRTPEGRMAWWHLALEEE
jgi:hypothetical protein